MRLATRSLDAQPAIWLHVGEKPMPVRIEDFFADTGLVFDHTLTFWDPQCLWASNALDRLLSPYGGALATTKLHVENQANALAVVHHRWLTTADAQTIGMVHVQDRAGASACETDVPLGIVESSSMAAIVLGGGNDQEVDRRLAAFCRLAAWRGPVVHALSLRGKAGARGRNKRGTWPRSIRTRSISYDPGPVPSSLLSAMQLMAPKLQLGAAEGSSTYPVDRGSVRPESVASRSHTRHPTEMNSVSVNTTDNPPQVTVSSDVASRPVTPGQLAPVLTCAQLSPGVLAVLVVDPLDDRPVLDAAGDERLAAKHLVRLKSWLRQATSPASVDVASSVESLSQVFDEGLLCVAKALQGQPRRYLVALGDPSRVAPRRLAWQLRVAANCL